MVALKNDSLMPEYDASPAMFRNHPIGFILAVLLSPVGVGVIMLIYWYFKAHSLRLTLLGNAGHIERGFLSKERIDIDARKVRTVVVNQSFWQRVFDVGTVEIFAGWTIQNAPCPACQTQTKSGPLCSPERLTRTGQSLSPEVGARQNGHNLGIAAHHFQSNAGSDQFAIPLHKVINASACRPPAVLQLDDAGDAIDGRKRVGCGKWITPPCAGQDKVGNLYTKLDGLLLQFRPLW